MHFLFVSTINAYKCHIINFLLTSLARYVQRNIGPRSFCTNLALRAGSVQIKKTSVRYFPVKTSRSVNKKLLIYILLKILLPHTRPHYLPVEDSIVLHIDNIFFSFSVDILGKQARMQLLSTSQIPTICTPLQYKNFEALYNV